PTQRTCGEPRSCDLNGCNGGFVSGTNIARCRGNYAGCACLPTGNTCGPRQSCEAGGCQGTINNAQTREASCKVAYAGCPCNPSSSTPQHCGTLQSCDFADCNGRRFNSGNLGMCSGGRAQGCP